MRDLVVIILFIVLIGLSLRKPFLGVLTYYWISLMAPHKYTWGFSNTQPLAMIAAIVTIISAIIHLKELHFPKTRETFLFLLFWFFITLTTFFSIYPDQAWISWQEASKVFIMVLLSITIVNTKQKLHYFLLAIVIFIGLISVKGAIFGILTGGNYKVWGPPDSNLQDNNFVGVAMVMLIPLCFFLSQLAAQKWVSLMLFVTGICSIITAVLTYSRGALIGLAVIFLLYLLRTKRKIINITALTSIVVIGINVLPSQWFDRMETINTYEEDASANQRLEAWRFSFNMAKANFLGGGFNCFSPEQYYLYSPVPDINIKKEADGQLVANTAHSIYFEVMAEQGFIGLTIYLLCLFSALFSLFKLNRLAKMIPNAKWIENYSKALSTAIIGFMACAAFVSRAYFELFWVFYAAVICLKYIVYSENWVDAVEIET